MLLCLHLLFNKPLISGYFPISWAEGYIVLLHKKGDVNNVNSYPRITLLGVLGKLFPQKVNNKLTDWAETYQIFREAQAGLRNI